MQDGGLLRSEKLLQIEQLKTYFYTSEGVVRAVDGVSLALEHGSTLGLVGESGCGKSITSLSVMRLIPEPPGRIVEGRILFDGEDLMSKREAEMQRIRGNDISMIFQEPMTSLNPLMTVGDQINESIELHQQKEKAEATEKALEMMRRVGIPSPERRLGDYPHQFSGGMRQRVMIAMALSCNPKLLIADEPTTALDVTIQAQIIDLLRDLQSNFNMAILYITHNLAVVAEVADSIAVMYCGKIVELTDVYTLFSNPLHPYTVGLMESIPERAMGLKRLKPIQGVVPDPRAFPSACRFHPRCPHVMDVCREKEPDYADRGGGHYVACWMYA